MVHLPFLDGVFVNWHDCKLFHNVLNWFPVCWTEIGTKHEFALEKEGGANDKGEGGHDIQIILELLET